MKDDGSARAFEETSYLYGGNAAFIEDLYARYLTDPDAVDHQWRRYFDKLREGVPPEAAAPSVGARPIWIRRQALRAAPPAPPLGESAEAEKQGAVQRLIAAYRLRGHQAADLDPLKLRPRAEIPELEPAFYDLRERDMDSLFSTGSLAGPDRMPLRAIVKLLREVYCSTLGAEFMHILDAERRTWVQQRLEQNPHRKLPAPLRRRLLERLVAAEGLERYLHTKYVGQKRFSLEGCEVLIPLLDGLIQRAATSGVREIVIGMAHRGRLNVLMNVLGKSPKNLFLEFEGKYDIDIHGGSGDVKYHLGYSSDLKTAGGEVHLALAFNPSHLEIIDPVVEGSVRARQQRRGLDGDLQVLPVLIHGDAAFAGQGVVMETFNLSGARGFSTGGTVHIVVNNQIGFTTSNPMDARSTFYCTDVAKLVQAPIFHANGDDPEAVLFATQSALDYRMTFKNDAVVDVVCYRRHGHNEADEPAVTQPVMYRKIREHPTPPRIYGERLVSEGVLARSDVDGMGERYRQALDEGAVVAPHIVNGARHPFMVDWSPYRGVHWTYPVDTAVTLEELRSVAERLHRLPDGFQLHPRLARIVEDRRKMAAGAAPVDWGFAETLAYATLVKDGYQVRLCGQDTGRGTFFHRHAVLHSAKDGSIYVPLHHVDEHQGCFTVIDSPLSEEAVLAFEYGYATAEPNALVVWEAQFGDFANGAQVVIDQFVSSGELKWSRMCGLVMLLPHGYEGQGPEHSSARLERYLQLCAEHNIQVCAPTTPAQFFHLLRRQMLRPYRKPLVVMSPKSLLRHKMATSTIEDLCESCFRPIIGEVGALRPAEVRRVVLCTGKVYYDLAEQRQSRGLNHIAIIRIEQLYPFPRDLLSEELWRYSHAKDVVWCQEEPKNQGAWYPSQHHIRRCMRPGQDLRYVGRPASASPAVGYFTMHVEQQMALVDEALQ
jgi:2-oxoglutarate dehydrogenase E1 component